MLLIKFFNLISQNSGYKYPLIMRITKVIGPILLDEHTKKYYAKIGHPLLQNFKEDFYPTLDIKKQDVTWFSIDEPSPDQINQIKVMIAKSEKLYFGSIADMNNTSLLELVEKNNYDLIATIDNSEKSKSGIKPKV